MFNPAWLLLFACDFWYEHHLILWIVDEFMRGKKQLEKYNNQFYKLGAVMTCSLTTVSLLLLNSQYNDESIVLLLCNQRGLFKLFNSSVLSL